MGDNYFVIEKGKKVKNPQTGMMIELPGKRIATIEVQQVLGNTPYDEISFVVVTDGAITSNDFSKYYISDREK